MNLDGAVLEAVRAIGNNERDRAALRRDSIPVLFHCTCGKDRTGVVVAALLTIIGVPREMVVQEYLWSEGEVDRTSNLRSRALAS